jgi:hypothetical protein
LYQLNLIKNYAEFNKVKIIKSYNDAAAPVITIKRVEGNFMISNNGLTNASVASLAAGHEFNAKVTYAGGTNTAIKVSC